MMLSSQDYTFSLLGLVQIAPSAICNNTSIEKVLPKTKVYRNLISTQKFYIFWGFRVYKTTDEQLASNIQKKLHFTQRWNLFH